MKASTFILIWLSIFCFQALSICFNQEILGGATIIAFAIIASKFAENSRNNSNDKK